MHRSLGDDSAAVEILPGAVIIDLATVDLASLTADELRDAFVEAQAQGDEAELEVEDLLGDLDLSPL
ncbi:hypothetical protein ACFVU2_19655 [Leifsonia sp. NPDC058194]|uniref:hypothetical protein n=1 Tax=Leifsonia sp. NPDC058194 TaxID=3346374 RepID=UPI0036DB3771